MRNKKVKIWITIRINGQAGQGVEVEVEDGQEVIIEQPVTASFTQTCPPERIFPRSAFAEEKRRRFSRGPSIFKG